MVRFSKAPTRARAIMSRPRPRSEPRSVTAARVTVGLLASAIALSASPVAGQTGADDRAEATAASGAAKQATPLPRPEDVASPEALVEAAYASISRRPGENFDWDRMASLFLPSARLVPNTEQTGGEFRPMSPEEFRRWIDDWYAANAPIGGPDDMGFEERQVHAVVERYGDIAHVMSTYEKRFWGGEEVLGRGINSFQLVRHDGRWWIAGIVWDEEDGAGPIPAEYLPAAER